VIPSTTRKWSKFQNTMYGQATEANCGTSARSALAIKPYCLAAAIRLVAFTPSRETPQVCRSSPSETIRP
jgi:hypothetical protein